MANLKTHYTDNDVQAFIHSSVDNEEKIADSLVLIKLMETCLGVKAKMWGPSIIGFGNYHYIYASGHEGDAPILGFSPRKAAISLYIYSDTEKSKQLLTQLGKFKMGKACIYVKKLADVDMEVVRELCMESIRFVKEKYTCD